MISTLLDLTPQYHGILTAIADSSLEIIPVQIEYAWAGAL